MDSDDLEPAVQEGDRYKTFEGNCEVEIGERVPHRLVVYHYSPEHIRGPSEESSVISAATVQENIDEGYWSPVESDASDGPESAVTRVEETDDSGPTDKEKDDDDPEHVCEECGESFDSVQKLNGHQNKHAG